MLRCRLPPRWGFALLAAFQFLPGLADQLRLARLNLSQRLLRPLPQAEDQHAEVQRLTDLSEEPPAVTVNKYGIPIGNGKADDYGCGLDQFR